jgi:hypothetical protein
MLQDQGTGQPSLYTYDRTTTQVEQLRALAPVRQWLCRRVDRNGGGVHAPAGTPMEAAYVDAAKYNKARAYGIINSRAASRHATRIILESEAHIARQRGAQQRAAQQ